MARGEPHPTSSDSGYATGLVRLATSSPSIVAILDEAYDRSDAARWAVAREAFQEVLERSVAYRFTDPPAERDLAAYLRSLHVADLALAAACAEGHDAAWDHFVLTFRPGLYAAARRLAGDSHRELADSLYAELFGMPRGDGPRRSLLLSYHGRSRLATWLRSVLAQRHIDRLRALRPLAPLDPDAPPAGTERPAEVTPLFERQGHVGSAQAALDAAIDALEPKDRLRLRLYYGQDLTLAQIGRLLGEHEATVSRHLSRARQALRRRVERVLAEEHGLSKTAMQEVFAQAAEAPELNLDRLLTRRDDG